MAFGHEVLLVRLESGDYLKEATLPATSSPGKDTEKRDFPQGFAQATEQ